jgi:hypothetical protein
MFPFVIIVDERAAVAGSPFASVAVIVSVVAPSGSDVMSRVPV